MLEPGGSDTFADGEMPLPARNSSRRRKKNPDNEERAAGDRPPDEVLELAVLAC